MIDALMSFTLIVIQIFSAFIITVGGKKLNRTALSQRECILPSPSLCLASQTGLLTDDENKLASTMASVVFIELTNPKRIGGAR